MGQKINFYYRLTPGVDIVPLKSGDVLFRSDTLTIRVSGHSARLFIQNILPLLDGKRKLSDITASMPQGMSEEIEHYLNILVDSGVIRCDQNSLIERDERERFISPFLAMAENLGIPVADTKARLGRLSIAIFGLEAHGAYLATILARYGVGRLVLIDPYNVDPGNLCTTPILNADAIGVPRQQALKAAMVGLVTGTEIITGSDEISADTIDKIAVEVDAIAGCFDKGFISANYWINQSCLKHNIPAIYAETREHIGLVGPLVLPEQSACYMCYRMRSIANADDYDVAMSYEEYLDEQKHPSLHNRPVFPAVPSYLASIMAAELTNLLLGLSQVTLADQVISFNALTLESERHPVLQKPDCPVCSVKKNWIRHHPNAAALLQEHGPGGDLVTSSSQLISERTGIIHRFQWVPKDITEPALPYIVRAELGNHQFQPVEHKDDLVCSGKGMSLRAAEISALGEAVERYSGAIWFSEEVKYAKRWELDGASLDPNSLVLYLPEQYNNLPYVPYRDDNNIGWVPAHSLIAGRKIFVPATAVYMSYPIRTHEELIAQVTSNGLATGPTLLEAVVSAAEEILERDAFLITWLNRLKAQRIDPKTHPNEELVRLCVAYRRRGVEMELYRLPTDHPWNVFMGLGVNVSEKRDGPASVVGLGSDIDASRAAEKALMEVGQVRPALRRRMRQPESQKRLAKLLDDPRQVASLEDHDLLYASSKVLKSFDFLRENPVTPFAWESFPSQTPHQKLKLLLNYLESQETGDLIYFNLTPPDMHKFNLYTVRVIIPGFQPIHFGWNQRRLAGKRLYELPFKLGQSPAPTTPVMLNPDPHPLP